MTVWHFLLAGTVAGTVSGEIAAARSRKLSLSLAGPSQVTFDMPGDHPQALQINDLRSDLFVVRDGEWLFKGRLGASQDKLNATDHTSSFTATDYRGMLNRRLIWPSSRQAFTTTEQAEIAWALIADTQSLSDLGIWRIPPLGGSDTLLPTGITRTMTFPAGQKIGEAITTIGGQTSGFEWDVSGNGQFQLFYPRRDRYQSTTPPTVAYGGEIVGVDRTVAGTTFANCLYYTGAAGLTPVTVVASDTTTYGRFESAIGNINLKDQASVGAAAGMELAVDDNLQPAYTFTFAPGYWSPDLYWLGDSVNIFVNAGRLNINQTVRITGLSITLDDAGGETVAMTVAQAPSRLTAAAGFASPQSLAKVLNNHGGRVDVLERTIGQTPAAGGGGPAASQGYVVSGTCAVPGGGASTGVTFNPSSCHPAAMSANVSASACTVPVASRFTALYAVVQVTDTPYTDSFYVSIGISGDYYGSDEIVVSSTPDVLTSGNRSTATPSGFINQPGTTQPYITMNIVNNGTGTHNYNVTVSLVAIAGSWPTTP